MTLETMKALTSHLPAEDQAREIQRIKERIEDIKQEQRFQEIECMLSEYSKHYNL